MFLSTNRRRLTKRIETDDKVTTLANNSHGTTNTNNTITYETKCYTTTEATLTNRGSSKCRGRVHSEAGKEEPEDDDEETNEVVQDFQNLEENKLDEE